MQVIRLISNLFIWLYEKKNNTEENLSLDKK